MSALNTTEFNLLGISHERTTFGLSRLHCVAKPVFLGMTKSKEVKLKMHKSVLTIHLKLKMHKSVLAIHLN